MAYRRCYRQYRAQMAVSSKVSASRGACLQEAECAPAGVAGGRPLSSMRFAMTLANGRKIRYARSSRRWRSSIRLGACRGIEVLRTSALAGRGARNCRCGCCEASSRTVPSAHSCRLTISRPIATSHGSRRRQPSLSLATPARRSSRRRGAPLVHPGCGVLPHPHLARRSGKLWRANLKSISI